MAESNWDKLAEKLFFISVTANMFIIFHELFLQEPARVGLM